MRQCPKCSFPLQENATKCPDCGQEVILLDEIRETVAQVGDETEPSKHDAGSDTVDFTRGPVSDVHQHADSTETDEINKTVDFSAEKTVDLTVDEVEEDIGSKTVDFASEKTIDLSPPEVDVVAETVDFIAEGIVDLNSNEPEESVGNKTVNFAGEKTIDLLQKTVEFSDSAVQAEPDLEDIGNKTVDFAAASTIDLSQQTIDFTDKDYLRNVNASDRNPANDEVDKTGTGTVDATRSGDVLEAESWESDDANLVMELEEDFETDDQHTTLNAVGDSQGTHIAAPPSDAFGDDQSTFVASPDSPFSKEHSDDIGTIQLPSTVTGDNAGDRTLVFGSSDTGPGTVEAGSSGTEGRLKRLWDGVAGSSQNPMHSLQASVQQASDSIFQRVATRRVADASVRSNLNADYQIVNKLGEGAMGIVYSARQTTIDRVVALKMAKPSFQQNEDSRRRFLYEAQITADLDHSNIVPIHEMGANESGELFYSMKLVQGTGWNASIRKNSREQNIEIFMKVADAIAFAHSKGVIHRDLKPENTMLGRFGEVFVTDWGTAINLTKDSTRLAVPASQGDKFITVEDGKKFNRGDTIALHDGVELYDQRQIASIDDVDPNRLYLRKKLTHTYQLKPSLRVVKAMNMAGTPCYMAPEMAGHDLPRISKLSDIYVLGAILYDMVIGRAPHTGKSVTECLRAALDNRVHVANNEDPLLTIAYKAMETEPENRFQSVEELQDAVREYRRHAESITLTNRSDDLLEQAIAKSDYEMFSRTIFGYRDAIDLWPENQSAVNGLGKARLAFGQAAFKQGNYDLVLQTVDRSVPAEDSLYKQAVEAKEKSEGREKSLKLLKRAIAAVVLAAVTVLSGLLIFAFSLANSNKQLAASEASQKLVAQQAEKTAIEKEADARTAESTARQAERTAKDLAEKNELLAKSEAAQKNVAKEAEIAAKASEKLAREAEATAKDAQKKESEQKNLAIAAEKLAKLRAAEIQLGEYNSTLALAKSQFESFDVTQGQSSLTKLVNIKDDVFSGVKPNFSTWGWRRVNLLSNSDLPIVSLEKAVSVTATSLLSNITVVGTRDGLIQVIQRDPNGLVKKAGFVEKNARINTIAISPDGSECVYGYTSATESGLKRRLLQDAQPQPVVAAGKRQFQRLAYTRDGKKFLAGINSGIWVWQRDANWFGQQTPTQLVDSIRGDLLNLQSISPRLIFVTANFHGEIKLSLLDHESANVKPVDLPTEFVGKLRFAAHTLVDDKVILVLSENRLMAGTLNLSSNAVQGLVDMEEKHRAQITQIESDGSGQLVTASTAEPVAHVWKYTDKEWLYDTFLTGTPKNLAGIGIFGEGKVLGVDENGTSILWDVERQKQRSRLQRQNRNVVESYNAAVRDVIAGASDGKALAIDANGVVDLWSLTDGSTRRIDATRWSYVGHTPGAELVDSAIDLQRGLVITAARLRNADKKYLKEPNHDWEFCIWDAPTGAMDRRWTTANRQMVGVAREETIEQRISLVDNGRKILFASDSETRFVDLETGRESFNKGDFGSFFAVPHPQNPSLVMLVKRSGAVRLYDLQQPSSWDDPARRDFVLAGSSEIPLRGAWSRDGQRFYLAFSAGGMAAFQWNGTNLKLAWSNHKLDDDPQLSDLREALSVKSGRVQSHLDIDLMVDNSGDEDLVYVATRNRGEKPSTKVVSLRFARSAANPTLVNAPDDSKGVIWLQEQNGKVSQSNRIHDMLILDSRRVRSRQAMDGKVFVSTDAAQVYGLADGKLQIVSYGTAPLVSTTGSADGKTLVTLMEDGSIWSFTTDGEKWKKLSFSALGATQVKLSPDASKLMIMINGTAKLVSTETGNELQDFGTLQAADWDRNQPARLAIARADGSLELWTNGQLTRLAHKADLTYGGIVDVQFFVETWKDQQVLPRQHLMVHTENTKDGTIQFVPLTGQALIAENIVDKSDSKAVLAEGTRLKASPTEGIFVSAAKNGTVTVWYATPTYQPNPRQLFDLEGHRGADITCLSFTNDGKTIITADSEKRLFAWLSNDPLSGK